MMDATKGCLPCACVRSDLYRSLKRRAGAATTAMTTDQRVEAKQGAGGDSGWSYWAQSALARLLRRVQAVVAAGEAVAGHADVTWQVVPAPIVRGLKVCAARQPHGDHHGRCGHAQGASGWDGAILAGGGGHVGEWLLVLLLGGCTPHLRA